MNQYLNGYLEQIRLRGNNALALSISKTVSDIVPKYIADFSFDEHIMGLLIGDVQSGKTSHMLGLACAAADAGFGNFILLTTDNSLLQGQTFDRAESDLAGFCVCGENDYIKFSCNKMKKPAVIVIKKNVNILRQWKNHLASTQFVKGNPLFILDDEGDAESLNTQVNKNSQSTINKCLEGIRKTSSSSIYLSVTGTPQSILLQSKRSGWKPAFIYYFKPGNGYIGGNFFFAGENNSHIVFTGNDEASELLNDDDEFPENGLKEALLAHLVTAAHIKLHGGQVCNFLIHTSVKKAEHSKAAEKAGEYLNELLGAFDEPETKEAILNVYKSLKETKPDISDFDSIYALIHKEMLNDGIKTIILNSDAPYEGNDAYETGNNVIIGGNSLGRGITFPKLQTVYYCRTSKNPQADTMWQHARMFGYDRDPDLMRLFIPPKLFKLFSDINATNNAIISQIESSKNGCDIKICYPEGLKPTRKNVLDKKAVRVFSGGVNYFPFSPVNSDIDVLDKLLSPFCKDEYSVSLKLIAKILQLTGSESDDWDAAVFEGFVNALISVNPSEQGTLIVRRNRDIRRGTGTLLSPNDRVLGDSIKDRVVLTLYKVTGAKDWNGEQIWIPNIKLPGDAVYYSGDKNA